VPAPSTTAELISLVRRSELVDNSLLDSALPRLNFSNPPQLARALIGEGLLTHFHAEQLLLGKCRGFTIGNYRVLERLGSGGMALVYLCEHLRMKRRVAIKVLPTSKSEDTSSLKRFIREARAAASLDHPNIVRAYDLDEDETRHFLVMEYVDGGLLGEIVRKQGPMGIHRACHYVRQASIGLQHVHDAGLVHRDIKPDNLIVDRGGTVKILDLGLARFLQGSEEVLTHGILGTPDYVAPEQCQDSHNVDIRADIYSMGGTLYFLLTGSPPFGEGTVAKKLLWHQTRPPRPVKLLRPEVPETLAQVVHKMLAKKPAERYQLPSDIVKALIPWTKNPIAPPSAEELPRLSPAAGGMVSTDGNMGSAARAAPDTQSGSGAGSRSGTSASPAPRSDPTAPMFGDPGYPT